MRGRDALGFPALLFVRRELRIASLRVEMGNDGLGELRVRRK
jgi:hypothetical protein